MRVSGTVQDSIVDGPGLRFTVFTQGCPHGCEGCHNPQTHDFNGGSETTAAALTAQMLGNPLTDGLTLSGGEPFAQAEACAELAEAAKAAGLNVWVYSGWTFEELLEKAGAEPEVMRLLRAADVLVDGRFELSGRSLDLKWRGSRNQRIIDVPRSLSSGVAVES
ncbi:MAG: anaerobic ribonucleoside-triphosphate reductase activating protein [Oscillospiraceae bacterium]|jgi:anaerobic ribonucleoside-triphosphate reductase activating protein|nr:anaerobic ribonucleoside-triphosphate reductase activating protein [Oscillospiraceae bacterium]